MTKGWHGDSYKHKLASKGVKSKKDAYRYGAEYVPETAEERRKRRGQTIRDIREYGSDDPDSLFFDPSSLEAEGVFDNLEKERQLEMGIEVESEHRDTIIQIITDAKLNKLKPLEYYQKMVAEDHIDEIKDYYTRLQKMEQEAGL